MLIGRRVFYRFICWCYAFYFECSLLQTLLPFNFNTRVGLF